MAGLRWGATRGPAVPLGRWALAFALLAMPTGFGAISLGGGGSSGSVAAVSPWALPLPSPNLTVTPSSGWVAEGNTTSLDATWTSGGGPCATSPAWFQWFLGPGPVGGVLVGQNASVANFTGAVTGTATTEVGVRSGATTRCGNLTLGAFRTAYATVTTVAPLELANLSLGPAPLVSAGNASLTGLVDGGVAPYRIEVGWGDGNLSTFTQPVPGPFEAVHFFGLGMFLPQVTATDASGLTTTTNLSQPLEVTPGPALAIDASTGVAEVGRSVRFVSVVDRPTSASEVLLDGCGAVSLAAYPSSANLTCVPIHPGVVPVMLDNLFGGSPLGSTLTLDEPVAPALTVSASALEPEGEVDRPMLFAIHLSGGVPPFELTEFAAGTWPGANSILAADGTVVLETTPSVPGFSSVSFRVSDADGAWAAPPALPVFAVPALTWNVTSETAHLPPEASTELQSEFSGGEGPVDWILTTNPPPTSSDPMAGEVPTDSTIEWSAAFVTEGVGIVVLTAVDEAGTLLESDMEVPLISPPVGAVVATAFDPPGGPAMNVTMNLTGGAPPFSVWVNVTGGGSWNATDPSDGPFALEIPLDRDGPTAVSVVAADSLGGRFVGRTTVIAFGSLAVPPGPPPSSDLASVLVGVLSAGLGLGALAYYVRRWRRGNEVPVAAPNPTNVLEGILAPADGAERVTVELLAEEAGVPLETVRSTLDRLIAAGRVRSEVSSDGVEVLAWSVPSPR